MSAQQDTVMVILYVNDLLGIAFCNVSNNLDDPFANLKGKNLSFICEGIFTNTLDIHFTRNLADGTLTLTQIGLIKKIKEATGMSNSNSNWKPAAQAALGIDTNGPLMTETWSNHSIVTMLFYLSANTCPDIAFAISQVARFCRNQKKSHSSALNSSALLTPHLQNRHDCQAHRHMNLDFYVNANFAGLHGCNPDRSPTSAQSRTGYIITHGLSREIYLSTLEAKYSTISSAMRILLPLCSVVCFRNRLRYQTPKHLHINNEVSSL